jgi:hypothetical protein
MMFSRGVGIVALAAGLLLATGMAALADDVEAASASEETSANLENRLAELDTALQELAEQQAELEQQREELEELKAEIASLRDASDAPPPPSEPGEDRYKYFGYTQLQTEWLEQNGNQAQLVVRRFFNVFDYQFDDETKGRLLLNTTPAGVAPLDAWVESTQGDIYVRAGQFIPPSGFDPMRSSSIRRSHEYATAWARLFPGIYDLGVMVANRPRDHDAGKVLLAVHNGAGPNRPDNDNVKDVVIHYTQPINDGRSRFHLTKAFGQTTVVPQGGAAVSNPKDLWAAGFGYSSGHWEAQIEAITGRAYGSQVLGGYVEGAYITGKHVFFGRYDYYNPNTATQARLVAGPRVGYEYHLGDRSKLSLEYSSIQDAATAGGDGRWAIRWQAKW